MSMKYDHEWLKARTVHIKGIPGLDRNGQGLETLLNRFLDDNLPGQVKVLALHLVPDFSKILEIEDKI